jgi:hypothetical protein
LESQRKSVEEAASSMVKRFGFRAIEQVDQRISELKQHEEADAVRVWQDIRKVVEDILKNDDGGIPH